ncbi:E3 ubiquitin-protein ligase UBR2-like isoform X4 [Ictalurus furcatus]|nr:E3 ubiquitin-protein ligase UBR2-like isoform X4 [Ictalurus furcatus]
MQCVYGMDPHTFSVMQEWCASDAEEAQRKLKRQNGEDPALPPFCPLCASLVNILQCDVLLGMLGAVLQWAMEPSGGHWSESMLQRTVWDKDKAERKRKAELCWKKTMAQTLESQSHFINKYIDLLTQDSEDLDASASTSAEHSPSSCDSALVCVGPRRWRARGGERRQKEMCILCHEAQEILPDGTAMVLAAFVQRSTVMSKNRKRPPHNPESYDPLFMHPDLSFGTHTGSCGHIMHSHCWQRYFETLQSQDAQWLHEQTSYDVENGEYLCPLCKCRSNTVIPLLPLTETTCSYSNSEQPGLAHWLNTTYTSRSEPCTLLIREPSQQMLVRQRLWRTLLLLRVSGWTTQQCKHTHCFLSQLHI